MKVTTEKVGDCQATLTIEVAEERVEKALKQAARRISKRTRIPGFRAGKAPYHIVERMVGKEAIFDGALEGLASEVYGEALEESELEPIDRAEMEVASREPLTLKMTVPLKPEVKLGDYQNIHVDPQEVKVEEKDVEEVLTSLREEHGEWVPVEREAQGGDLLTIDVEGRVRGKPVITVEEEDYILELSGEVPVKGFPEMIEGMKPGEEREFSLLYSANHPNKELAEERVEFKVRLRALKGKDLPPLDDEFAKMVGDFEDVAALKERVKEVLQSRAETKERERMADKVLSGMVAQAEIAYPPVVLEREIDFLVEDYRGALAHQGFTLEKYLESEGKSEEELRTDLRPRAEERLKKSLILGRFTEEEGISVEDEEMDQEVEEIAGSYGDEAEAVKEALLAPDSQHSLRSRLFSRKAMDRLVEIGMSAPQGEAEPEGEVKVARLKVLTPEDIKQERLKGGLSK